MERKRTIAWALFKTAVFTLVVPSTVGVLVPRWLLLGEGRREALPGVWWRWMGPLPLVAGACIYLACAWDLRSPGWGLRRPSTCRGSWLSKGFIVSCVIRCTWAWVVFGQAVLFGSGSIAIYVISLSTIFHFFVVFYEEPVLSRKFGEDYQEYCLRVPRWLSQLR
jgi:protein-S-isoprenylcysteine O-methyltransferase Ste14